MVVKSSPQAIHLQHIWDVFDRLTKFNIRLNPVKCSFGLRVGNFLGYIITKKGIKANPDQIRAIEKMPLLEIPKQTQILTRRLAALSRFVSRYIDKCQAFFKVLREAQTLTRKIENQSQWRRNTRVLICDIIIVYIIPKPLAFLTSRYGPSTTMVVMTPMMEHLYTQLIYLLQFNYPNIYNLI